MKTWDDQVRTRFSSRGAADKWNEMYSERTERADEHFFRGRRDYTVDYVMNELAGARRILDLGCGSGPVLTELRARGRACIGLDYSEEMLGHAHARMCDGAEAPAPLVQGDSRFLPFEDDSFDAVICLGVISYVKDYTPVLSELFRVLKPGGTAIVTFRNKYNPIVSDPIRAMKTLVKKAIGWKEEEAPWVGRWLDFREVCRDLSAAGLVPIGSEFIGYGPPRMSYKYVIGDGRWAIRASEFMTSLLRLPLLSRLRPWLCDVSIWIYQRPHIDGARVRVPAPRRHADVAARV